MNSVRRHRAMTNERLEAQIVKVSLGMRFHDGPWGGGNLFGKALVEHLQNIGARVTTDLRQPDIDVILLADPLPRSRSASFNDTDIARYLWFRNPRALVIHRINECDERKGTRRVNRRLIAANQLADHTVFIASWLKDLFQAQGLPCRRASVILNGADRHIFHSNGPRPWNGQEPLKFVTHHWGTNWRKGFDIYQRLDAMLALDHWRNRVAFTYVGRLPDGFCFANTRYVEPLSGEALADELRSHHAYLSASQYEPGGMHHIEGAMCGLPLLFRRSGALPEYCTGFGTEFVGNDFEERLEVFFAAFPSLTAKMSTYPHDSVTMVGGYWELIQDLIRHRDQLLADRDRLQPLRWIAARLGWPSLPARRSRL